MLKEWAVPWELEYVKIIMHTYIWSYKLKVSCSGKGILNSLEILAQPSDFTQE